MQLLEDLADHDVVVKVAMMTDEQDFADLLARSESITSFEEQLGRFRPDVEATGEIAKVRP